LIAPRSCFSLASLDLTCAHAFMACVHGAHMCGIAGLCV
jgi:hypothetical protein